MKKAFIFPGQGSQYVGMGHDFYLNHEISRDIFERLNLGLERDLVKLIFSGDEKDLAKTENSQPAIMATSIAIYEAIKHEKLLDTKSVNCVAGHSLGEYSALVVNKCIEFEDSIKLLKFRSKAMQDSMPIGTGGMVALIGCDDEIISETLSRASKFGEIYVANDNAKDQVVLSGEIAAIEYITSHYKELNIRRAIALSVSAPFHCKLINNAAKAMDNVISNYNFNSFAIPFYSNVTANKCSEKEIAELLVNQIISKVRWREIIENMIKDGVTHFIEIGPGNVLTNLIKRASKDIIAISISKIEDLDKLNNMPQ